MIRPADAALLGRTIAGKFFIEQHLGSGAMGAVYRARQVALDKQIAIKIMHADLARDPSFATRFQREAKAASRLDHPNSVRVIDFGVEPDGTSYIAMELLAGKDLLTVMRDEWPLSGERIITIVMQALGAIAVAHGLGIVHRDLKPENIMVLAGHDEEGHPTDVVKVCDFGIAKVTNDPSSQTAGGAKGPLTTTGTLIGTPEYMSPEQGRGDTLDARSDLYSMGVILYQLLTGRVPFTAETAIGVILKHITDDPMRPSMINAQVDARLEAICLRAMRKLPQERYATARDMRADLKLVRDQVRGGPALAKTVPAPDISSSDMIAPVPPTERAPTPLTVNERPAFAALPSLGTPHGTAVEARHSVRPSRAPVLLVAAIALAFGMAGAVGVGLVVRKRVASPAASSATVVSSATEAPIAELTPLVPTPAEHGESRTPNTASATKPHASAVHHAPGAPSASPSVPSPPAPAPAPTPASTPAPAPTPSPAPAPTPSPAPAPEGPTIDPEKAWVEVGLVTPNKVKGEAVRAAVRQAPLTQCYRNALRARASRAVGVATLNLSIDETGRLSGAILTGADWLPEVIRCVQNAMNGVQLRPGSVESGGATAEVWLSFKMP